MSPTTHDRDRSEELHNKQILRNEELDRQRMSHRKQVIQTFLIVVIIAALVVLCIVAFKFGLPNEQYYSVLG